MRTHGIHLRAAASQFLAKYSSSTSTHPLTVTAEIAEAISSRSSRLTRLPSDVAEAIDAAAADSNRKAIRLKGRELTDELKRISRTKHRGGKYPNLHDIAPEYSVVRTLRGKRRQKENKALTELAQQHTPLAIEEHEPLPDSFWDGEERGVTELLNAITNEAKESATAHAAADGAMYQEDTAAAYAVTRFPACYAALRRVLLEVQRTAPRGWVPESILDFGAGPGTATWAAHSIWSPAVREGGRPLQVTAVDPSGAMAWLGQDIQQRLEEAYQKQQDGGERDPLKSVEVSPNLNLEAEKVEENEIPLPQPPMIRWMSRLSGSRGKRNAKEKKTATYFSSKKYDVVIAGYVLSEIPTPKDRRKLITDLWNRTGQYLILVEPGTPVGSDMIQLARSQILGLSSSVEKTTSFDSSSSKEASNTTTLVGGAVHSEVAAHVVAPCPHDGPCPLKQGSRASWCHFIQRFERTAIQRRVKMMKGKLPPRSHQDERFSYVVLKRGPRGGSGSSDDIEGDGNVFKEQVGVVGSSEKENGVQENDEKESEFLNIPENLKPKRIFLEQDHLYSETDEDVDLRSETDEDTFGDEAVLDEDVEVDVGDDDLEATERELRRLLLDSISNENSSDDSDSDEENANELPPELEQVLQRSLEELRQNNKNRLDTRRNTNIGSEKAEYAREDEKEKEEDGFAFEKTIEKRALTKGLSGPEAEEAARRSSSAWSRIIRPARKRSGHVVLDLCSAVGVDGEPVDTTHESSAARPRGMLLRQIVSKGKANREIGGIAPFKLARRAAWGDLWPLDYQRKMKSFEPPSGGGSSGGDASGDNVE